MVTGFISSNKIWIQTFYLVVNFWIKEVLIWDSMHQTHDSPKIPYNVFYKDWSRCSNSLFSLTHGLPSPTKTQRSLQLRRGVLKWQLIIFSLSSETFWSGISKTCNLQRWILRSKSIFIVTQKHKFSLINRSHNVKKLFGLQFFDGRIIVPVLRIRILIFWMLYTEQRHLFLSEQYYTYNLTNTSSTFCFDLLNGSFLVVVNFSSEVSILFSARESWEPEVYMKCYMPRVVSMLQHFFSPSQQFWRCPSISSIKNPSNWKFSQLKES